MAQTIASVDAGNAPNASQAQSARTLLSKISDPFKSLLLLRYTLLNVLAFSLLAVSYTQGYVQRVIEADQTYLSVVIFIVFLVGLGICTQKVWQTNSEIDALNSSAGINSPKVAHLVSAITSDKAETRANLSGSMRMRVAHRISVVRHLGNTLVLLGLIGTVLGFIIALSGVDPEKASDVNSIAPMVSTLIQGMSTALYTTLIGSILNVWLMANYQLLTGGTVHLISSLQEQVERNA
jgi:hypothetical protein